MEKKKIELELWDDLHMALERRGWFEGDPTECQISTDTNGKINSILMGYFEEIEHPLPPESYIPNSKK